MAERRLPSDSQRGVEGVKRVALRRHSRAGGMAVGRSPDFDVLEGPVLIRPLRPTQTGKGRERGHSPLPIKGNLELARSIQCYCRLDPTITSGG